MDHKGIAMVSLIPIRTVTPFFQSLHVGFGVRDTCVALRWSSRCSVALLPMCESGGENQSKLNVDYSSAKWMERVTWHSERADGTRSQISAQTQREI